MTTQRSSRAITPRGGFTIIELVITITVIAVLVALLLPVIIGQVERARLSAAKADVNEVGLTLARFHADTGYWPYQNEVWSGIPEWPTQQVEPARYNSGDTALFQPLDSPPVVPVATAAPLVACTDVQPGFACYNGPYLSNGGNMAAKENLDPWGNPLMYAYVRPSDSWGGGTSAAPNGFVTIWSTGPDGIDETGCTEGAPCSYNVAALAGGNSSIPSCESNPSLQTPNCSDDIVFMVGTSVP